MKFPFITLVLVGAMTSACTATSISFVNPTSTPDTEVPAATPTQFVADTVGDKTQCPVENPNMVPNFAVPPDAFPPTNLEQPILDFLNAGGSRHALIAFLRGAGAIAEENLFAKDVTGDATPELIVGESHLRVYACQNQKYYVAADIKPWTYQSPTPVFIGDMNQNGVPELVIDRLDDVAVDIVHEYQILEWDGQQFRNLISPLDLENRYIRANSIMEGWIVIGGITHSRESNQWAVRDTDNNGTLELILTGGISVNNEGMYMGPYRVVTTIYMWNGKNFVIYDTEYEPPQFRFQAVQDADYAVIKGQYDKALTLYQQVIFSDTLAW